MNKFLKKLISWIAYLAAGCVIALAVIVGLFRLMLPRLPEYQEDIKRWATGAIGMGVEFSGMNARWRLSGPELNFYNAELSLPDTQGAAFGADEVSVSIDLMRLLLERTFSVDSVMVRDTAVRIEQDEERRWTVQGVPLDELSGRFATGDGDSRMTLIGEDIGVTYLHPVTGQTLQGRVENLRLDRSPRRVLFNVLLTLPESLGERLNLGIVRREGVDDAGGAWQYNVEAANLKVAGWSALQPTEWPSLASGNAAVNLSFQQRESRISNASIEFEVTDLAVDADQSPFGARARFEFQRDGTTWLLVADDLRLQTMQGSWPASNVSAQGQTGDDGSLQSVSVNATYLDLDDLQVLEPWLDERFATVLQTYDPSGRVRNVALSFANLQSEQPDFDIALDLEGAGIAAHENYPGVREFTGSLRANASGGRIEMASRELAVAWPRWLGDPVALDVAEGTLIWRRNLDGIIVLSDDIALRNRDIDSHSNVQLSLPGDGSAPVLDLESRWNVADIATARRYLPKEAIRPGVYNWLQGALVRGSIPAGYTRFSGALDAFPFDNGEGVFRTEAQVENATLLYSDSWPAVQDLNAEVIVDRTRLYSTRNSASNAGNEVVNAAVEIADLRRPVLTIKSLSTGTLESIRRFVQQSPVADMFGGRVDLLRVAGDASFTLDLTYPIRNREAYEFLTRIQVSDGMLGFAGFRPPVEELNGRVIISRTDIEAETLSGRFLGEPVDIALRRTDAEESAFSVVAEVRGRASANGLATHFSPALDDMLEGGSDYLAELRFPRRGSDSTEPFTIHIASALEGLAIQLPAPLDKSADEAVSLEATILFPAEGRVEAQGVLGDDLAWNLAFLNAETGWDFDRGVLAAGGAQLTAAATRGLHVIGRIPELRLDNWLDATPSGAARGGGVAARIRSLDISVGSLHLLGQQFGELRLNLDRSGNNWLVQVDGTEATGSLSIPYDFASGRTLSADMEKLLLPGGDDSDPGSPISADPRQLPPVSFKANEFAFGDRFLGRVAAEFSRSPNGLVTQQFTTEDRTFSVAGSAGWVIDVEEPAGQKTWVQGSLQSSDVAATMQRLGAQAGIAGESMRIDFDVNWPGGPREDFLEGLDGNVTARFGTGRLDEIEPGAGRMFGLMSVVALPRRLALDFRDVLDKGFLFDEIYGTFRIVDGQAYTCDLSLKGPAADVGIVGRAGLVEKDYAQTAVVSANVGNTLPVVGAVVAGPQAAAALLIFSRIFKKPLQELDQAYYAIEGSWDEPAVEPADAARFAEVSRVTDCLAEAS